MRRNRERDVGVIVEGDFAGLADLASHLLRTVDPNDTGLNARGGDTDAWRAKARHRKQQRRGQPCSNPQFHLRRVCHNSPMGVTIFLCSLDSPATL